MNNHGEIKLFHASGRMGSGELEPEILAEMHAALEDAERFIEVEHGGSGEFQLEVRAGPPNTENLDVVVGQIPGECECGQTAPLVIRDRNELKKACCRRGVDA